MLNSNDKPKLNSEKEKPTFVIYFDEVITSNRTSCVVYNNYESEDLYIKNNLKPLPLERLKAYLDTLHFKGYRLLIINYMEKLNFDKNVELYGKNLIKRYLDFAFGDNRLYLHDDAIYISTSKDYIQACVKIICGISQEEDIFPRFRSPVKRDSTDKCFLIGASDTDDGDKTPRDYMEESILIQTREAKLEEEKQIEKFWGNAIFFAPTHEASIFLRQYPQCLITVSENIAYFDRLDELVNFKHVYYPLNYTVIDNLNQIPRKEKELHRTSISHNSNMYESKGLSLKIAGLLEISKVKLKFLEDLLKIDEQQRNIVEFEEKYEMALREIKSRINSQIETFFKEQNSKEKILEEFNLIFEDTTNLQLIVDGYKNRDINLAITSCKNQIAEYLNKPALYQAQQQDYDVKMHQIKIEEMRQQEKRKQLKSQLLEKKKELKTFATEVSKKCMSNKLDEFTCFQKDKVGWFGLTLKEFINQIDYAIGLAPLHIACRFGYIEFVSHLINNEAELELKTELGFNEFLIKVYVTEPQQKNKSRSIFYYPHEDIWYCSIYPEGAEQPTIFRVEKVWDTINLLKEIAKTKPINGCYKIMPHEKLALYKSFQAVEAAKLMKTAEAYSAIHETIRGNHFDIVKLLLERGANVNSQGSYGRTPFYTAVMYGCKLELLELLIKFGADVNIADNSGLTPLHKATEMGNAVVVWFLLNYEKTNYFAKSKKGDTALVMAIKLNQQAIILQFMDKGITITHHERKQLLELIKEDKNIKDNILAGLKLLIQNPFDHMYLYFKEFEKEQDESKEILSTQEDEDSIILNPIAPKIIVTSPSAGSNPSGLFHIKIDVNEKMTENIDREKKFVDSDNKKLRVIKRRLTI